MKTMKKKVKKVKSESRAVEQRRYEYEQAHRANAVEKLNERIARYNSAQQNRDKFIQQLVDLTQRQREKLQRMITRELERQTTALDKYPEELRKFSIGVKGLDKVADPKAPKMDVAALQRPLNTSTVAKAKAKVKGKVKKAKSKLRKPEAAVPADNVDGA